jgi:hypothetical protein
MQEIRPVEANVGGFIGMPSIALPNPLFKGIRPLTPVDRLVDLAAATDRGSSALNCSRGARKSH